MKCPACNYEYERGHDEIFINLRTEKIPIEVGDEPFIEIKGHFTIGEKDKERSVKLVACPNCGTVQVPTF